MESRPLLVGRVLSHEDIHTERSVLSSVDELGTWELTELLLVDNADFETGGSRPNNWVLYEGRDDPYLNSLNLDITVTPEPSSIILAAMGLAALAAWGWRRNK